jgi:hypothetical protein
VVTLSEELKDSGTQEFQSGQFAAAAEKYSEALLLAALQRLCFATTCHTRLGAEWAGSGARLPHAISTVGDIHLLVVSHLPPACGNLAVILHSNQAECMLRLNRWADALIESYAALDLDPAHDKSANRNAKASAALIVANEEEPDDGVGAHVRMRAEKNTILKLETSKTGPDCVQYLDELEPPPREVLFDALRAGRGLSLLAEWKMLYNSLVFESFVAFAQGDRRTVSNDTTILKFSLGNANFALVYEHRLEGVSYHAGDQIAIEKLVFTLLDEDGEATRVPSDGEEEGYVTIGFKAFATTIEALECFRNPDDANSTPLITATDGTLIATPADGCQYRSWGDIHCFAKAVDTSLLPHELVHFLLRYCAPVFRAVEYHWVCVCLQKMFGTGVPHMCKLGMYKDGLSPYD